MIPESAKMKQIIEFYQQTNNIELSLGEYASLAATLANGGLQPETSKRCVEKACSIKNVLSHMMTSGMKQYSGEWNFRTGLPAKSSFSGVTILVVPNVLGIAVYSPLLNECGNSERAQEFLLRFTHEFGFDSKVCTSRVASC